MRHTVIPPGEEGDFFWGINDPLGKILAAMVNKNISDSEFQKSLTNLRDLAIRIREQLGSAEAGLEWILMYRNTGAGGLHDPIGLKSIETKHKEKKPRLESGPQS